MRIALDYYRILGLPIQATAEQLQQAYNDRTLQLPRREYSELAISSRLQLLDDAFAVLSNPDARSLYDASLQPQVEKRRFKIVPALEPGAEPEHQETEKPLDGEQYPHNPSLEIPPEKFLGALLILHELGEYELVIRLSQPYFANGNLSISVEKGTLGDQMLVRSDIVLTVASAYLELGREEWQQGQYENAAESLQAGQKLLAFEGLFPNVRSEIQVDLYKLRPYRILELLALPEENVAERRLGLRLLQEMLQERGGIDGSGDDQSGLTIDDFLRFIQQLRSYLTAAEQKALFEAEAKRPSAVATYLTVYALIARGYGQGQPAEIARAKKMLIRLGRRQDVHLEQAVCAMLLGQAEAASRALELSQEYEPLAFIREHSQGYPDLLPGLCLYTERWLLSEVFPHFRDLASVRMSLKDYFALEQVQAYLEALPAEADTSEQWSIVQRQQAYVPGEEQGSKEGEEPGTKEAEESPRIISPFLSLHQQDDSHSQSSPAMSDFSPTARREKSTSSPSSVEDVERREQAKPKRERESEREREQASPKTSIFPRRKRRSQKTAQQLSSSPLATEGKGKGSGRSLADLIPHPKRRRPKFNSSAKTKRLFLVAVVGIVGVGVVALLAMASYSLLHNTFKNQGPHPATTPSAPDSQVAKPPLPTPAPSTQTASPQPLLTDETALIVIQSWLNSKELALGQLHQVDCLKQILATPALDRWLSLAQLAKKNNSYSLYKHSVQIKSVKTSAANSDRATVEAAVNEFAQLYQKGQREPSSSYNDHLRVKYDLVRQHGQWRISNMSVLT